MVRKPSRGRSPAPQVPVFRAEISWHANCSWRRTRRHTNRVVGLSST